LEINAVKTKQKDFDASSILTGSINYQYWQDLKSIPVTKCNACPMQINKQITIEDLAGKYKLVNDSDHVETGTELTIQLRFTIDRAMDYIHLQDKLATPFEIIDQTSHLEYGSNFMYYKSTADDAANFFIDHIEKGSYQISYKVRVVHRGWFNTGIATLQCFYAPQFISNTNNNNIEVR